MSVAKCLCLRPPYPMATFRKETLISVVLCHWRRDGCPMPDVALDCRVYLARS